MKKLSALIATRLGFQTALSRPTVIRLPTDLQCGFVTGLSGVETTGQLPKHTLHLAEVCLQATMMTSVSGY